MRADQRIGRCAHGQHEGVRAGEGDGNEKEQRVLAQAEGNLIADRQKDGGNGRVGGQLGGEGGEEADGGHHQRHRQAVEDAQLGADQLCQAGALQKKR